MFTSREQLKKRTGKNPVDRPKYLAQLVDEFKKTNSLDAKQQVLANLANFCYDPINYAYLKELQVANLFLEQLDNEDEFIVEIALGGLCNFCLDREIKEFIIGNGGIKAVAKFLESTNEEILISAITILLYLVTPQCKGELTSPPIVERMTTLSKDPNRRVKNLADIFLTDICTREQAEASSSVPGPSSS